jgi:hypothetical protein
MSMLRRRLVHQYCSFYNAAVPTAHYRIPDGGKMATTPLSLSNCWDCTPAAVAILQWLLLIMTAANAVCQLYRLRHCCSSNAARACMCTD